MGWSLSVGDGPRGYLGGSSVSSPIGYRLLGVFGVFFRHNFRVPRRGKTPTLPLTFEVPLKRQPLPRCMCIHGQLIQRRIKVDAHGLEPTIDDRLQSDSPFRRVLAACEASDKAFQSLVRPWLLLA